VGLTCFAYQNLITPRTSQSAGFDIGAFIVTTRYTHNVNNFAAPTAPGNYLHSTEHTTWLIWYNETTARVMCANVLYFLNIPHNTLGSKRTFISKMTTINGMRKKWELDYKKENW